MKKIDNSDALMFGISANHEIMDNDEMRFRLYQVMEVPIYSQNQDILHTGRKLICIK